MRHDADRQSVCEQGHAERSPSRSRSAARSGGDAVFTERAGHATELARRGGDAEAVVVFSGDGGFNEALNGVDGGDGRSASSPGGGTSVLPRALGLPRDPVAAARRLATRANDARISLGRVNGRRFGFAAGIGFDAELVRRDRRARPARRRQAAR